jgi:Na+-driven multidrug efflux pump
MIIPALVNIALDFVFIKLLDLGLYGAALQRAFLFSLFSFYSWYFIYKTELKLQAKDFKFHLPLSKKSPHLAWSLSRQGVVSILAIILNHTLYFMVENILLLFTVSSVRH